MTYITRIANKRILAKYFLYSLQINYLHWKLSASRSIFSCYATYWLVFLNLESLFNSLMDSIAARRAWASDVIGYCRQMAIFHSFGFPLHYGVSNLTSTCPPWRRDFIEVLWAPMEHAKHPKRKKTLLPIVDRWAWSWARAQGQRVFASFWACFHWTSIKPSENLKENSENAYMKFHDFLWSFYGLFRNFSVACLF